MMTLDVTSQKTTASRVKLPHLMEKSKRDRSSDLKKNPYLQKIPVKNAHI
jgi:hypothetical protein